MAANDQALEIRSVQSPTTLAAPFSTILGTSTPAELFPVFVFDKDTIWYMDFHCRVPEGYAGGGFTVVIWYSAASATLETVWSAAFRAIPSDAEDLDTTAHTYVYNAATVNTAPSAVLRVRLVADDAGDDMDGDAYVHAVSSYETA